MTSFKLPQRVNLKRCTINLLFGLAVCYAFVRQDNIRYNLANILNQTFGQPMRIDPALNYIKPTLTACRQVDPICC
jgi:hypothetical protein